MESQADSEAKATQPLVVHVTPDQGWAWVISIACAIINGITFGLIRSYGVIFSTILDDFKVSRQTASWPFCLCTTFTHLSGPVAGLLLSRFSLRVIVFSGSLLAAISMSLCFFADSIIELNIYIGVMQGFGIGLSFMQTPVILAQYFEKYRATATAISYAGGTIGSFIFPPILEYILAEYGLNGSFLIIGGIMLNALPFSLLLRPATPSRKVDKLIEGVHKQVHRQISNMTFIKKEKPNEMKRQSMQMSDTNSNRNKMHMVIVRHKCTCDFNLMDSQIQDNSDYSGKVQKFMTKSMIRSSEELEENFEKLYESRRYLSDYECNCIVKQNQFEESLSDGINDKACQTSVNMNHQNNNKQLIYSVLTNPLYLILCITHVSFQWAWMTHQMIIIDFSIDRGMSKSQAVILLSSFAVADLFGRLASGLMVDKRLVRKRNIVSICILLIGVLIFMTPSAQSFRILLVMTIGLGFVSGSIIVLFSILTMEYVGLRRLPIALGTSALVVGVTTLFRPLLIGYFRDTFQSYDGLFYFIGSLALLTALLWLSEPFARLWVTRRRKYGYGFKVSVV